MLECASLTVPGQPNFFLVGASKAGTTSIHHYLGQHPDVFMSPVKEPHFLADEVRPENFCDAMRRKIEAREPALRAFLDGSCREPFSGGPVTSWEDYLRLFQCAGEARIAGESSPCYLWSPTAPANIAARFPDAKIAMILRNPVDRAFAQYVHMLMFATAPVSFREHVETAFASTDRCISELYPYLEFGSYSAQVKRYLALFPSERVHISFYEKLTDSPDRFMQELFRFLQVDEKVTVNTSERHMEASVPRSFALQNAVRVSGVANMARALLPDGLRVYLKHHLFRKRESLKLLADDRRWLVEYYREDVLAVSELLQRDLSHWLRPPASS